MTEDIEITIAKNIKKYRKRIHMTQATLAEQVHKTPEMICRIENNKTGIRLSTLVQIAEALGIPSYQLVLTEELVYNCEDKITSKSFDLMQLVHGRSKEETELLISFLKTFCK